MDLESIIVETAILTVIYAIWILSPPATISFSSTTTNHVVSILDLFSNGSFYFL